MTKLGVESLTRARFGRGLRYPGAHFLWGVAEYKARCYLDTKVNLTKIATGPSSHCSAEPSPPPFSQNRTPKKSLNQSSTQQLDHRGLGVGVIRSGFQRSRMFWPRANFTLVGVLLVLFGADGRLSSPALLRRGNYGVDTVTHGSQFSGGSSAMTWASTGYMRSSPCIDDAGFLYELFEVRIKDS